MLMKEQKGAMQRRIHPANSPMIPLQGGGIQPPVHASSSAW